MRVGVIGCGFVFDLYMATWSSHPDVELAGVWDIDPARCKTVAEFYGVQVYDSEAALLSDPTIDTVANFTPLAGHVPVTTAALNAGKHVYCEKPLAPSLAEARALFELADQKGLRLSVAPSNALSSTIRTLKGAVDGGLIGDPKLVYAEFDDGPIHLMRPETWVSPSGAPWPLLDEFETGCTLEHAGYHLTWLCALFGPVERVTAFSDVVTPQKSQPAFDTPDFSLACLRFRSGVVARLTCSLAGPRAHGARVFGETGELRFETYKDYSAPVHFDRYDWHRLSISGSRFGRFGLFRWLFGAEPAALPKVSPADGEAGTGRMDMVRGLAELAAALKADRAHFPPPDIALHVTELTLAIQAAGREGAAISLETDFQPLPEDAISTAMSEAEISKLSAPSRRRALADAIRRVKPKRRFT